jgi:hypothetical protein
VAVRARTARRRNLGMGSSLHPDRQGGDGNY